MIIVYSFKNDYSEGAHPQILNQILKINAEQNIGYGQDQYSELAKELIKNIIAKKDAAIHFLVGGTQTNLTVMAAFLRPYEAVIAPHTGHILVHETGAIESTGHKIISVATTEGKLTTEQILAVLKEHTDEHMVKPKMVYISQPTEIGTIYSYAELNKISELCKQKNLYFYIDGARLGSALMSEKNDVNLAQIAQLTDAFYIGGTKNGALFGEALVICRQKLQTDFRYHIKQRGAMLAKGQFLGVQFWEMFKAGLYYQLAEHANKMAKLLKMALQDLECEFLVNTDTNQIFPILSKRVIASLEKKYSFYIWQEISEDCAAVRLVTSWATSESVVQEFVADLKQLLSDAV